MEKTYKNFMLIEGAKNCAYKVYQLTEKEFNIVFPGDGQDVQFTENIRPRTKAMKILAESYKCPIDKKKANGIDGILFHRMDYKKIYYPNLKESDLNEWRPSYPENV